MLDLLPSQGGKCLLCCSHREGNACFATLTEGHACFVTIREKCCFAPFIGRDMLALPLLQEEICLLCCFYRKRCACFDARTVWSLIITAEEIFQR